MGMAGSEECDARWPVLLSFPGTLKSNVRRGARMESMGLEDPRTPEAERFAREVLPAVSRTFALSIRVLPGTLGQAVLASYLLCRIADTLEDEPSMPAEKKAALLDELLRCFDDAAAADAFPAHVATITGEPAHVRLTRNTDLVFVLYRRLPEGTRRAVRRWVSEMIVGMRKF